MSTRVGPKMIRKIKASKELCAKEPGVNIHRRNLRSSFNDGANEWRRMKDNNSQECRNCHNFEFMD
ncbi:NapC/NirT family cytochrome c [Shigella flexneri]